MIIVGLMVGGIFGLLTAIGAEMVGGGSGLGNRLVYYSSLARMSNFFAVIILIAAIGIGLYVAFYLIGKKWANWELTPSSTGRSQPGGSQMKKDTLTRRQFLGYSSAMGVLFCIPANPLSAAEADKIVWVSPRGNLEVMDDFNLWVAHEMGYFKELNLDVVLQPGPTEAMAVTKLVGQKQADIGFPSPGVLLSSIDAGIPVVLVWEMVMKQVFDFALPENSPIAKVQDLEGKTIAVASEGWRVIIDPILVEAGLDPKSVTYLNGGPPRTDGAPARAGFHARVGHHLL